MAADVGERVAVFLGEPVLEVRVAVVVRLDQLGLAATKLAEPAATIQPAGVQGPAVESLVILDADEKPLFMRQLFQLDRLRVFQYQRLDRQHVLIAVQGLADHGKMEMVGHGHDDQAARRERGNRFLVEVGKHPFRRFGQGGHGFERPTGKRKMKHLLVGQVLQGRRIERANRNRPDLAEPLQVIERRQQLVVGNHAPADDQHFNRFAYFVIQLDSPLIIQLACCFDGAASMQGDWPS